MQASAEKETGLQGGWAVRKEGVTKHCSLSGVMLPSADLGSRRVDFLSCFQLSSLFRMRDFQGGCQHCTAPLLTVNPRTGKLHNGNCEENTK